jgi:hypothetical protein
MKITFFFLGLSAMFLFSNCKTTTNAVEPIEPAVVEKPMPVIEMLVSASQQKMIPYEPLQSVNFQLQTSENVAYQAKSRETAKSVAQATVKGVPSLVTYETMTLALLPNKDEKRCLMLTIDPYAKLLNIAVEDNYLAKKNFFHLCFDDNNNFYTNKDVSNNTIVLTNSMIINNILYAIVYKVTNPENDKLWFSPGNGVVKAELADGRTWNRK